MTEQRKSETERKPTLRFKGFTDPWEQRKAGEVASMVFRAIAVEDDREYQLITVRRRNEGVVPRVKLMGSAILVKNYQVLEAGDFVISKRQLVHGGNGCVPNDLAGSIVSNEYLVIVDSPEVSAKFWALLSKTKSMYRSYFLSSFGVDIEKLVFDVDDWSARCLFLPSAAEQRSLCALFQRLDSLITLHQRKVDKLKTVKQSLLDRMFPKEGESVPELRFAGFTDPWEQRKVGDFLTESRELGASGNVARKLTVKLWGKGVMEKSGVVGSEHTQYYVRRSGQFIYSKLDFLNAAFGVIPDQLNGFESTADLPAFDVKNLNANFLLLRATQKSFYLTFGMVADGSRKAKRVHANTFLEMPLLVPCVEEQCAIAALFARLDSLITLHQREGLCGKYQKESLPHHSPILSIRCNYRQERNPLPCWGL